MIDESMKGGSYTRQKDGSLTLNQRTEMILPEDVKPEAATAETADASGPETSIVPPKSGRTEPTGKGA